MAVTLPGMPRNARVVFALGGELWAFMAALHRGEFLAGPGILSTFQRDYNTHRSALVAHAASQGATAAELDMPAALGIDGRWGSQSAMAARAVLYMLRPAWIRRLRGMPTSAGALGTWWNSTLASQMPDNGTNKIWDAVRTTEGQGINAGVAMNGWAIGVIDNIAIQTSAPRPGTVLPSSTGNTTLTNLLASVQAGSAAAGRGSNADLPGVTLLSSGGETFFVPGKPPAADKSDWVYFVIGAGVLALGGVLAFNIYRRRR